MYRWLGLIIILAFVVTLFWPTLVRLSGEVKDFFVSSTKSDTPEESETDSKE